MATKFDPIDRFYDYLLEWKDSDEPEDIRAMQRVLYECGFWASSKAEASKFLTPFHEGRRSYVITAPDGWEKGEFPVPGEYSFARITKNGTGPKDSSLDFTVFHFAPEEFTNIGRYSRGYLFTFLEEKKDLCLHNNSGNPGEESPFYGKFLKRQAREAEIRQECVNYIPELVYYTWPDTLEISGAWEEKERSDPDFFKRTFEMLTSGYYPFPDSLDIPFKPLVWENKTAKITTEITYVAVEENARYMYGIVEKVPFTEEIGVWVSEDEECFSFKLRCRIGDSSFRDYHGKLFPDTIEFVYDFFFKLPEKKVFYIEHFAKFGLEITNL